MMQLACICKKNNILLIVVTPPCADYYLKNVGVAGVQNMYALIHTVQTSYPIEYSNYLDDKEFRNDSIYYNANHLNSIGAEMFAKRIKVDFKL